MKPRYDAHGNLNFWFILPTQSLRDLVERKLLELYPTLNYGVGWKDVHGWGLNMSVCGWKPANSRYYYRQ